MHIALQPDHRQLHDVGRGSLDRHVDGDPLRALTQHAIRRAYVLYIAPPVQQRFDITLFSGLDLDAFEKLAHPVVGAKVGIDENSGLFCRHAGIAREAEVTEAVEQAEVHDLGQAPLIRGDLGLGDAEDLGCRAGVDVLTTREGVDQDRIVRHVGQDTQLDL